MAAEDAPGSRRRLAAYGTAMMVRREVERYMVVWSQTVVPPIVSAGLFLFVFGHALGSRLGSFHGVPYLTFLVPGLLAQGALTNAYNNTGSSLFDARRARYIQDVLTSPLTDAQVVLAYMLSGASRGVLIGLATLAMAVPFTHGWAVDPLLLLAVLLGMSLLFALLGVVVGLHATRFDHIFAPIAFLLTPLTFLGGVFYPVSDLPPNLAAASRLNPILYLVDAQRSSLLGHSEFAPWPTVLALYAAVIVLFAFTVRLFQRSPQVRG